MANEKPKDWKQVEPLTDDELTLLEHYRTLRGQLNTRRTSAIAKALGTPTPAQLRAMNSGYGKGSTGGKHDIRDPYLQGRRDALRELYESGGLPESQLGLEVLYLLPDDFVKFYTNLFHTALNTNEGASSGKGGGIEKAKGTTGTVLGSETRAQAQGTGKRYKVPTSSIRSERALRLKSEVDRDLLELTSSGLRRLKETNRTSTDGTDSGPKRCQGLRRTYIDRSSEDPNWTRPKCGTFLKANWIFCPKCGTKT